MTSSRYVNLFGSVAVFCGCLAAAPGGLKFVQVLSGIRQITNIEPIRDGSRRMYLSQHSGVIQEWNGESTRVFLDIRDRVFQREFDCCEEQGLLGFTFPMGNGIKDHVFVSYVDRESNCLVSRFAINVETGLADPGSEVVLRTIPHPDVNHFGGTIAFHPVDGLLYWSMGDGSAGFNVIFAQDPKAPYGKMLRFDPYAAGGNSIEVYAIGLRNPYKFDIDPATGDFYIGDVGENAYEEMNFIPNGTPSGTLNFGWGIMEGNECYEKEPCSKEGLTLPAFAYDHDTGCSVTAGKTYRGGKHPEWYGKHFLADFCKGTLWNMNRDDSGWTAKLLREWPNYQISTFGEDDDGELYVADYIHGIVYRLEIETE